MAHALDAKTGVKFEQAPSGSSANQAVSGYSAVLLAARLSSLTK